MGVKAGIQRRGKEPRRHKRQESDGHGRETCSGERGQHWGPDGRSARPRHWVSHREILTTAISTFVSRHNFTVLISSISVPILSRNCYHSFLLQATTNNTKGVGRHLLFDWQVLVTVRTDQVGIYDDDTGEYMVYVCLHILSYTHPHIHFRLIGRKLGDQAANS